MEHLWTALFCTIHLCLGYIAGRSGRGKLPAEAVAAPAALIPAVTQFERAYGVLQPSLNQLPHEFQAAVEELKASVSLLAQELTREKEKQQTRCTDGEALEQARNAVEQMTAKRAVSMAADNGAKTEQPSLPGPRSDKRGAERLGYAVPEYMALFEEDLQSLANFEEVQCHDLSATGVSFFLERPLDTGDNLLITLGQQSGGAIMAAKVVYSRPIIVRGEDRYRVGCQFLRRLAAEEAEQLQDALAAARATPVNA